MRCHAAAGRESAARAPGRPSVRPPAGSAAARWLRRVTRREQTAHAAVLHEATSASCDQRSSGSGGRMKSVIMKAVLVAEWTRLAGCSVNSLQGSPRSERPRPVRLDGNVLKGRCRWRTAVLATTGQMTAIGAGGTRRDGAEIGPRDAAGTPPAAGGGGDVGMTASRWRAAHVSAAGWIRLQTQRMLEKESRGVLLFGRAASPGGRLGLGQHLPRGRAGFSDGAGGPDGTAHHLGRPRMPSSAQGKRVVRGVAQVWAGGREVDSTTRRGGSSERARTLAGSVAS